MCVILLFKFMYSLVDSSLQWITVPVCILPFSKGNLEFYVLQIQSDINKVLRSFLGYSKICIFHWEKWSIYHIVLLEYALNIFLSLCFLFFFSHCSAPFLNGCRAQYWHSKLAATGSFLGEIASWLQGKVILRYQQNRYHHHVYEFLTVA